MRVRPPPPGPFLIIMPFLSKEDHRIYQLNWIKNRRKEFFDKHGPCIKCGSDNRLELDHIDPALKVSHKIWSWSWEKIYAEAAKCQILCYDCHKEKISSENKERNKNLIIHGTYSRYRAGCRCLDCVLSRNKRAQKLKEKYKANKV